MKSGGNLEGEALRSEPATECFYLRIDGFVFELVHAESSSLHHLSAAARGRAGLLIVPDIKHYIYGAARADAVNLSFVAARQVRCPGRRKRSRKRGSVVS